jgi:hypothetical protein
MSTQLAKRVGTQLMVLPHCNSERKGDTEFWDSARRNIDSIESIGDVGRRDRKQDLVQDTVERMSELHRFATSEGHCFGVDEVEGVVNDSPRAAVAFGDYAHGRKCVDLLARGLMVSELVGLGQYHGPAVSWSSRLFAKEFRSTSLTFRAFVLEALLPVYA